MNTISQNLSIVAIAIDEIVLNSELFEYAEAEKINYQGQLIRLVQKYLSFYNEETQYDIIMKMFTKVYMTDFSAIEEGYDPTFPLSSYLYTIMKNDIILTSQAISRQTSKTVSAEPMEDETYEDSWNRLVGSEFQSSGPITRSLSKEEEEEYQSLIEDYTRLKNNILAGRVKVKDIDKSVKNITIKIEKIRIEMQKKDGFHQVKYIDNSEMRDYQNIDTDAVLDEVLSDVIPRLKSKLRSIETSYRGSINTPWDGDRMKFLDLILADFSFSECAIFFEVTPTSTNKWAKQIQQALYELADELELEHDDDDLVIRMNNWLDDLESEERTNRSQSNPRCKDKAELYKQIIAVFGAEFMQLKEVME